MNRTSDHEPMTRALLEVVHSVRGLINRTKGIWKLNAPDDPMNPIVHRTRGFVRCLEQAVAEMAFFDAQSEIKIDRLQMGPTAERVVLRCVEKILENEESPAPQVTTEAKEVVDMYGSGEAIGIPELLSFLETIGKSGRLEVVSKREKISIVLLEGQVVHACSDTSPAGSRLGDILVRQGATTEEKLQEFVRNHVHEGEHFGERVVQEGIASREELQNALEFQIRELFCRMFDTHDATFRFFDGRTNPHKLGVHMNLTRLLLESSFEADERAKVID